MATFWWASYQSVLTNVQIALTLSSEFWGPIGKSYTESNIILPFILLMGEGQFRGSRARTSQSQRTPQTLPQQGWQIFEYTAYMSTLPTLALSFESTQSPPVKSAPNTDEECDLVTANCKNIEIVIQVSSTQEDKQWWGPRNTKPVQWFLFACFWSSCISQLIVAFSCAFASEKTDVQSIGMVAGAVTGIVAGALLIFLLIWLLIRRKDKKRYEEEERPNEIR